LPSEDSSNDENLRKTKENILNHIGKVDREITKVEHAIAKLKKSQVKLL